MTQTVLPQLSSLTLPWPVDWAALFGAERPLILEIGFGRGAFLVHLARTRPDASIIGLEISNQCLVAAEKAILRHGLSNVRVIHSMAETALHHLFVPASLEQVHVNFPDPWFKSRHQHRRLMQRATLDAIVSRLKMGGEFYLATDILEYAEMSAELLAQTPGLDNLLPAPWVNKLAGRIVTKYEARARAEGCPCYYFAYRRNAHPAPDVPVIQELEMPHIVFTSRADLDSIFTRFEPWKFSAGDIHVHFLAAYRGQHSILFETHIAEPTIDQRIALMLLARPPLEDGTREYTLQLSTLGHPRPTAGIHRAVSALGDWLLGLHEGAQAIKLKVRATR